jgi:hypothetical protein
MYIELETVSKKKYQVESQAAFKKRHPGITTQALRYAMDKDLIDYTKISEGRVIVLSPKTSAYTPNSSKKRLAKIN